MRYDIVTVDWHPEQTKIWKHYVHKNCPDAAISLVKDTKPLHKITCGMKPKALLYPKFKTGKVVYLDTDTIVTEDLGHLFQEMGDKLFGVTFGFNSSGFTKSKRPKALSDMGWAEKAFKPNNKVRHYFNGMMLFNGFGVRAEKFALDWFNALESFQDNDRFLEERINDEIAMAYVVHRHYPPETIWEIPLSVHCNIAKTTKAGGCYPHFSRGYGASVKIPPLPHVLHYHGREFLQPFGLEKLLDIK